MSDALFDIPETVPAWVTLKEKHGIQSIPPKVDSEEWTAKSQSHYAFSQGKTEREAVVSLIHELKLFGWETVSVNP